MHNIVLKKNQKVYVAGGSREAPETPSPQQTKTDPRPQTPGPRPQNQTTKAQHLKPQPLNPLNPKTQDLQASDQTSARSQTQDPKAPDRTRLEAKDPNLHTPPDHHGQPRPQAQDPRLDTPPPSITGRLACLRKKVSVRVSPRLSLKALFRSRLQVGANRRPLTLDSRKAANLTSKRWLA